MSHTKGPWRWVTYGDEGQRGLESVGQHVVLEAVAKAIEALINATYAMRGE